MSELKALNSYQTRLVQLFNRFMIAILSKVGLKDLYSIYLKKFVVRFPEEEGIALRLPRYGDFGRSVNLLDQREILHRALISHAIQRHIIDPSRNIVDAGAANGDCALVWAKMISGTVYAIDPSENNLRYINKIANLNNINNIKTINRGLGESPGWLYPLYNVDQTPFSDTPITTFSQLHKVLASTLDKLEASGELCSIGFMHLDVEGMELSVIRGAQGLMRENMPVLTFEAHISIDPVNDIFEVLRQLNYVVFMINEVTPGGRPDCVNFMALPSDVRLESHLTYLNSITPISAFYKATIGGNLIKVS